METMKPFSNDINTILELGCGNGTKLAYLSENLNAEGYGVDLSSLAIHDATKKYPDLKFELAGADEKLFERNQMDLIYLGFFLYVLDCEDIYTTFANVDYYLRDGGFVVILDFDFGFNAHFPYVHNNQIITYKSDYAKILLASGHYHLVRKESFQSDSGSFSVDPNTRISIWILFKSQHAYIKMFNK